MQPDLIQPGGATPQYNEDECHSPVLVPDAADVRDLGLLPDETPYTDPNCACFANPGASCATCTVPALLDLAERAIVSIKGSSTVLVFTGAFCST